MNIIICLLFCLLYLILHLLIIKGGYNGIKQIIIKIFKFTIFKFPIISFIIETGIEFLLVYLADLIFN